MSQRWFVRILYTAQVAWFRRARSLLGAWVLACLFVLGIATPSRAEGGRAREVRVCVRPPGVPANLDRWVHSPGGKVLTERWALMVYKGRPITIYVFDPKAPAISATYFPPGLLGDLKCPAKVAPKKLEPKAPRPKSEAGPRKKKGAEEPKPKEPEGEEREATKARPKIENDEAKRERERREEQAREEELHRWRERERPKVLPRDGVTAAWPSKVLPEQKREGVTAAWPSKVLLPTRVLPMAGAPLCGAPAPKPAGGRDNASTMAVREPILKELLAYKKVQSPTEKEAHRRKLRELFESVGAEAAEPFQLMLGTPNALAVTFREVLKNDPLQNELLGILGKKLAPAPAQCPPPPPSPAPTAGVTLPAVALTDEGSVDALHALLQQRTTVIREACERIVRFPPVKNQLLKFVVDVLSERLTQSQRAKVVVFAEANAAKKAAGLKTLGDVYTGLLYVTQLWQLYVNIAVVTDWADAEGEPSTFSDKPKENPLAKRLVDFEKDNALLALTQAGLDADTAAMAATLPAASQAYDRHVTSLDRWITSIQRGAFVSKKIIQLADIAMLAISIHQVAKMPVVPPGASPAPPPKIVVTLPGGAAVSSVVSLPDLARAVEAIRKLVASGALDGALIAGIGKLGGGPNIALPELQRPTSLSVQGPGSGSGAPGKPIDPKDIKGARPFGTGGRPGHPFAHGVSREDIASVINDPKSAMYRGTNTSKPPRPVDFYHRDGTTVVTEQGDPTRVITAFGRLSTKSANGQPIPRGTGNPSNPIPSGTFTQLR